jgi:hypothetical protein
MRRAPRQQEKTILTLYLHLSDVCERNTVSPGQGPEVTGGLECDTVCLERVPTLVIRSFCDIPVCSSIHHMRDLTHKHWIPYGQTARPPSSQEEEATASSRCKSPSSRPVPKPPATALAPSQRVQNVCKPCDPIAFPFLRAATR